MRDVLVFTPIYRLEPETVSALCALEWDGALSLLIQRDNPQGDPHADHLHQYQRGRAHFLAGPYDALLVIESDIQPPPDALMRLARLECDVAYGCYQFRQSDMLNVLERYYPWPQQACNMGESLQLRGLWDAARQAGVIDCSGAGLGCVLIHRHVVEAVPFQAPSEPGFFDWHWTQAVYRAGYRMQADTRVLCGHKHDDGRTLWPRS